MVDISYAEDDGELSNLVDSVDSYDIDDAVVDESSFAVVDISYAGISFDGNGIGRIDTVDDKLSYAEDDGNGIVVDDESSYLVDSVDNCNDAVVDISFDKLSYDEDDGELSNLVDSVDAYDIDDAVVNGPLFAVVDISYSLDADVVDASLYAEDDGDWIAAVVDDAYELSDVIDSVDEYDIDDAVVDEPS